MSGNKKGSGVATSASIGLGAVLAVVMSWTANKAVLWALFHGLLGWLYVVYYLFAHSDWTWL